jgi:hypothetical protein
MKNSKSKIPQWLSFSALLATILAVLFWKSFLPDYVQFSNDGPLGQQNTRWSQVSLTIGGAWADLNSLGNNAGSFTPNIITLVRWILHPVGFAKFFAPISLFILGFGAWFFFRALKLTPLACVMGGLAACLSSTFFSDACWGTASHQIAFGMDFFALGLIVSNSSAAPWFLRWARLALAGLAVGLNVTEAADIGAIFSLFVAAFTLFHALAEDGPSPTVKKFGRGIGRIAIIAIFAGFIAAQTIISLIGTQIEGIAGTGQSEKAKAAHWDFATQWSLPKIETLGIAVPGLFGYRMDTPDGGNYWGAVGRDPAWDGYFADGEQGSPPPGGLRFSGTGNYAGTLVILVALWAIAQSLRRQNSIFSKTHRQSIWFWTAMLIVSLLLAFGRFAPFYHLVYALPYFSTIRNPIKFLFVFTWAIVIIFACGIHGLSRRYLEIPAAGPPAPFARLKTWWRKARGFDRNWTSICVVFLFGSLLAWLVYALQKPNLVAHLQKVGFPDENTAGQIASFSIWQVGWFILFFALAMGLLTLVLSGVFTGPRARLGGILLGTLLILDLGRADLPWIIYWNYPQKYASNPIVDILRNKPYEHRVAYGLPQPIPTPSQFGLFSNLYDIEWIQQLFPYYNIQSLDIVQMPRMPADLLAYENALRVGIKQAGSGQWMLDPTTFYRVGREWQLTNTRYLLGPAALLDLYNQQFDPAHHSFGIVQRFDVVPKPGIDQPTQFDQLTARPDDNGNYALFEFTNALPRAKLYSHWEINTNDDKTLKMLASENFDPQKTVLLSTNLPVRSTTGGTNENPGTVEFKSYAPKDIVFSVHADAPSVLLLNSKYDPNWRVFVDGKREPLLRCNFIMRGVYLTPGTHTVKFKFSLPSRPLYVSLSAIGVGILLCGLLYFSTHRKRAS